MDGESYSYTANIKNPSDIGVSSSGSISALSNDIQGIEAYVDLLITGSSKASKTGGPMGNKYFFNTRTQCVDINNNNNAVDRYIYMNNVPDGEIPFLSAEMGDIKQLRGLVPGILGNMANISVTNPITVYKAFQQYGGIPCQQLTMQTIDTNNNVSSDTQYVSTLDIEGMDPCWFPDGTNPVTNKNCQEIFSLMKPKSFIIPKNPLVQLFFLFIGFLFIYFLFKIVHKLVPSR